MRRREIERDDAPFKLTFDPVIVSTLTSDVPGATFDGFSVLANNKQYTSYDPEVEIPPPNG